MIFVSCQPFLVWEETFSDFKLVKKYREYKAIAFETYLNYSDPKHIPSIILGGFGYDLTYDGLGMRRCHFLHHCLWKVVLAPIIGTLVCINCWIYWDDTSKSILIGNFFKIIGVPKVIILPCGIICYWYPFITRTMILYLNCHREGKDLLKFTMVPMRAITSSSSSGPSSSSSSSESSSSSSSSDPSSSSSSSSPDGFCPLNLTNEQVQKLTLSCRPIILGREVMVKTQHYGIISFSLFVLYNLNVLDHLYLIIPGLLYTFQMTQFMELLTETTCATFLLIHVICSLMKMKVTEIANIPVSNENSSIPVSNENGSIPVSNENGFGGRIFGDEKNCQENRFEEKVSKFVSILTTLRKFNRILKYIQGFTISFSALIMALLIYMLVEMDVPSYFIVPLALTSTQFAFLLSVNVLSSAQVDTLLTRLTIQCRREEVSKINHTLHHSRFRYNYILNGSMFMKSLSCFDAIPVIDYQFYLKVSPLRTYQTSITHTRWWESSRVFEQLLTLTSILILLNFTDLYHFNC